MPLLDVGDTVCERRMWRLETAVETRLNLAAFRVAAQLVAMRMAHIDVGPLVGAVRNPIVTE